MDDAARPLDDAGLTVRSPESSRKAPTAANGKRWRSRFRWLVCFLTAAIALALGFGFTAPQTAAPSAPSDEFEATAINITVVLDIL